MGDGGVVFEAVSLELPVVFEEGVLVFLVDDELGHFFEVRELEVKVFNFVIEVADQIGRDAFFDHTEYTGELDLTDHDPDAWVDRTGAYGHCRSDGNHKIGCDTSKFGKESVTAGGFALVVILRVVSFFVFKG